MGLGAAARVGVYDYLGYYDICYIGEEVKDPGRVIPRSILVSLSVIAVLYLGMNLSVIGVVGVVIFLGWAKQTGKWPFLAARGNPPAPRPR
jgi:amino acid transporter